jgi:hypothetical protein
MVLLPWRHSTRRDLETTMTITRSALSLLALAGLAILPACGTSRSASTEYSDSDSYTIEPATSENSTIFASTTTAPAFTPANVAFRLDAHILEGCPTPPAGSGFSLPTSAQPVFLSTDDRAVLLTRTPGFTIVSNPTIFTTPGQEASISTADRDAVFNLTMNPQWQPDGSCRLMLAYNATSPGATPYTIASRTLTIPADTTAMFLVQPSPSQPAQFLLVAPRSLTTAAANPQ